MSHVLAHMIHEWTRNILQPYLANILRDCNLLLLFKVIDIPHSPDSPLELCYDPDWLMTTKATSSMFPITPQRWLPPLVVDDFKYVATLWCMIELCYVYMLKSSYKSL